VYIGSILLELKTLRRAGYSSNGRGGGDPLPVATICSGCFGHPEVLIIFLPAASTCIDPDPVFAQRPLVGYRWIVQAIIVMGFISFGLCGAITCLPWGYRSWRCVFLAVRACWWPIPTRHHR